MNREKVSLIAAVYKDVRALELIINSLRMQTYKNFELVVAEDGSDPGIKNYLETVTDIELKHTTQDDTGIRKSRSQNNAIIASTGTYLIFIDGDCIPYSTFIEGHIELSEPKTVIAGRRVNLGPKISQELRTGRMNPEQLETKFLRHAPALHIDGSSHIEQGIKLSYSSFIYQNIFKKIKRNTNLVGCNFSCHRDDIMRVNGFDESYTGTSLADDTDIQWRFVASGVKLKSGHNIANMFHLHHSRENRIVEHDYLMLMINKMKNRMKDNQFICKEGISSHL
jgi:glycosyltransferase involved in cell wall biosynthesis